MASVTTRDHKEIRHWADEHGATPAVVSRTGGMLRFEFEAPAELLPELAEVGWDDFFHVFDERGLELVYDDRAGSRFHKLVYPETMAGRKPTQRPGRGAKVTPIASARGRARTAGGRGASAKVRGRRPTASSSRPKTTHSAKTTRAKRSRPRVPRKAA